VASLPGGPVPLFVALSNSFHDQRLSGKIDQHKLLCIDS
jgi:hypothetical protein